MAKEKFDNPYWDDEDEALDGAAFAQHPGKIIKGIMEDNNITAVALAEHIGVARPGLNLVLNGKRALTGAMASRIGDALNYPGEMLNTMMARHEFATATAEPLNHVKPLIMA